MRTRRMLAIVLVMVLLASAVPMVVTPAAATYPYEKKIPGDADGNNELTKEELVSAILPYMLDEGDLKLDDVGDAAYVYAHWGGKPKMVVDGIDREVAFYRPIERIYSAMPDDTRIMIALGACDKLAGVSSSGRKSVCYSMKEAETGTSPKCAAELCEGRLFKLPVGGTAFALNPEFIVSLKPDVFFAYGTGSYGLSAIAIQEQTGIPVAFPYTVCATTCERMYKHIEVMGILLDKEEEAEELISFIEEKFDKVREVTSQIPEEEKPKVYFASRGAASGGFGKLTSTLNKYEALNIAGGINVAEGSGGPIEAGKSLEFTVSKEQIIAWNPDIILVAYSYSGHEDYVETVLSDPDLQLVNAVKNKSVYYSMYPFASGSPKHRNLANMLYLAKLFHPEEFKDLDVEEEGNEIWGRFLGVDGIFTEYTDYEGWLREWLDKQK